MSSGEKEPSSDSVACEEKKLMKKREYEHSQNSLLYHWIVDLFSFEWCTTKTKQPIMAEKLSRGTNQSSKQQRANRLKRGKTRAGDQVRIGFTIESDWSRK